MSLLQERLLRRVYDSAVNALAMATAYSLTGYYNDTIGVVFVSLGIIVICEYMMYVIESNIPKTEITMADLIEVCRHQQKLIKAMSSGTSSFLGTPMFMHDTMNTIELLLNEKKIEKNKDMKFTLFVLLQEVLKIISRSAYFFSTYFLVKLYSSYNDYVDEYITLLYFSVIIILAPIVFIMLHAVVVSPEKKI